MNDDVGEDVAMKAETTASGLTLAIKAGDNPSLIDGWLLGVAACAVRHPLRWLAILPLSSIVGALGAVFVFLLFFFSKWILLLAGLLLLEGESINLWPKILFCMKVGAVLAPVVIVCCTIGVLAAMFARCGGISALHKFRRMGVKKFEPGDGEMIDEKPYVVSIVPRRPSAGEWALTGT